MKTKLQKLNERGFKVRLQTRWGDNAWDVWIFRSKPMQKEHQIFDWDEDIEKAIQRLEKVEE